MREALECLQYMILRDAWFVILGLAIAIPLATLVIEATRCLSILLVNFVVNKTNNNRNCNSYYQSPHSKITNASTTIGKFRILLELTRIVETIPPKKTAYTSYYDSPYPKYLQPIALLVEYFAGCIISRLKKVSNQNRGEPIKALT